LHFFFATPFSSVGIAPVRFIELPDAMGTAIENSRARPGVFSRFAPTNDSRLVGKEAVNPTV
jgi:hypothetical protein